MNTNEDKDIDLTSGNGKKNPVGRPSLYNNDYHPKEALKLSLLGLTDEKIAKILEINCDTLNTWKKKYPDFSESLKRGKDDADSRVSLALYNKAINGDVTAQIFWLKNRQPDVWREKQVKEIVGANDEKIIPTINISVVPSGIKLSKNEGEINV